jgi:hypothetical protein
MVYENITFGPSDNDSEKQSKEITIGESNQKIVVGGDLRQDGDNGGGDDGPPEYTYGCVRRITVDGDTNPCPGNVQTTKDYGDRFYRECPACEVEHPMEKVSENDD